MYKSIFSWTQKQLLKCNAKNTTVMGNTLPDANKLWHQLAMGWKTKESWFDSWQGQQSKGNPR
jgi:hypothetical protein